jgi:hypothetical protein
MAESACSEHREYFVSWLLKEALTYGKANEIALKDKGPVCNMSLTKARTLLADLHIFEARGFTAGLYVL